MQLARGGPQEEKPWTSGEPEDPPPGLLKCAGPRRAGGRAGVLRSPLSHKNAPEGASLPTCLGPDPEVALSPTVSYKMEW